jgi:uncharacterized membrane protein YcaP (DUF421 family)
MTENALGGFVVRADIEVIINTTIALLVLLIVTRIMGRKSIAQLTFFDYVIGITIGSIASSMAVNKLDIYQGTVSLVTATVWVLIINIITHFSLPARKLINSAPIMVIYKGQMLEENIRKKYYNINDILEQLREKGIFDPGEVEVAIAETDGELSILKKPEFQSIVASDLNIYNSQTIKESRNIGKELIISGKIIEENLIDCSVTIDWLNSQLQAKGIEVEDVTLAMLTPQGMLYIDKSCDNLPAKFKM